MLGVGLSKCENDFYICGDTEIVLENSKSKQLGAFSESCVYNINNPTDEIYSYVIDVN